MCTQQNSSQKELNEQQKKIQVTIQTVQSYRHKIICSQLVFFS